MTRQRQAGRLKVDNILEWCSCSPAHGSAGFARWCQRYVRVFDKQTRRTVPFELFEGQRMLAPLLCARKWIVALKGRQLGFTTLVAGYAAWMAMYGLGFSTCAVAQERQYSQDFLARIKFIWRHLPTDYRLPYSVINKTELRWLTGDGQENIIRSIVGSENAARSMTADFVFIDEASRVKAVTESLTAIEPAVEVADGQIVVLSTSAGPAGDFYELWQRTYGEAGELVDKDGKGPTKFHPVFLHWSLRPGRDSAWYREKARELAEISPVAVKQEYPNNVQEAWEYATGRIYPLFRRDVHVRRLAIPRGSERYRAVDWGQSASPQVCLWAAHVEGPIGLLIDPRCPNTIREMSAYRWDPDNPDRPLKRDDHTCDALRYLLMTCVEISGCVYIYQEMYIDELQNHGRSILDDVREIHELSGWERADATERGSWVRGDTGDPYVITVADRAWPKAIETFCQHDIPTIGHKRLRKSGGEDAHSDTDLGEVKEGIKHVGAFVAATEELVKQIASTVDAVALQVFKVDRELERRSRVKSTTSLDRRLLAERAKRLLRARR